MLLFQPSVADTVADNGTAVHWHRMSASQLELGLKGSDAVESMWAFNYNWLGLLSRPDGSLSSEVAEDLCQLSNSPAIEILRVMSQAVTSDASARRNESEEMEKTA